MKKKKITLLAVVLATAAMFTGCTIEDEYVPVDTEVQVMETNDMGTPSLSQTLDKTFPMKTSNWSASTVPMDMTSTTGV
jgi:hypothetical protein